MHLVRRISFLIILAAVLGLSACTDTTGPNIGSGDELSAKIEGTTRSFSLQDIFARYDSTTHIGSFSGTILGTPSKVLMISFTYDIIHGTFPKTLKDPEISITYTESDLTTSTGYVCAPLMGDCTLTITRSDGSIVDGTFAATLTNSKDSTKTISVSGGTFSAKVR